jgi:hypothetical protein
MCRDVAVYNAAGLPYDSAFVYNDYAVRFVYMVKLGLHLKGDLSIPGYLQVNLILCRLQILENKVESSLDIK